MLDDVLDDVLDYSLDDVLDDSLDDSLRASSVSQVPEGWLEGRPRFYELPQATPLRRTMQLLEEQVGIEQRPPSRVGGSPWWVGGWVTLRFPVSLSLSHSRFARSPKPELKPFFSKTVRAFTFDLSKALGQTEADGAADDEGLTLRARAKHLSDRLQDAGGYCLWTRPPGRAGSEAPHLTPPHPSSLTRSLAPKAWSSTRVRMTV